MGNILLLAAFLCMVSMPAVAVSGVETDVEALKKDVEILKQEVGELKGAVQSLKDERKATETVAVAVFPASLNGEAVDYKDVLIEGLNRAFESQERFVPAFSYYALDRRLGAQPLGDRGDGNSWDRSNPWETGKPDTAHVSAEAKKLGVDAALLVSITITGTEKDGIGVYLLDVSRGKWLSRETRTPLKHTLSGILLRKSGEIEALVKRVFFEYRMAHES